MNIRTRGVQAVFKIGQTQDKDKEKRENISIRGKGLTSLTLLILRHLRLNTILNKIEGRLYIIDGQ